MKLALHPLDADTAAQLRRKPPRAGEASFFFDDPAFGRVSVKVLPGEFYVCDQDLAVSTTLGSCVAACLHDPIVGVGGMNHFMLPEAGAGEAGGRFGVHAMELLINEMLKRGARRHGLEAKIFGGGQVVRSLAGTQIGEKNVAFVQEFLAKEGITVRGSDLLDFCPRKVCFFPRSGHALCKRLPTTNAGEFELQEARYRDRLRKQGPSSGSVELFS